MDCIDPELRTLRQLAEQGPRAFQSRARCGKIVERVTRRRWGVKRYDRRKDLAGLTAHQARCGMRPLP